MSLDKAIKHRKEKRKPYYGCKSFDPACRNHGADTYMCKSRLHKRTKGEQRAEAEIKDYESEDKDIVCENCALQHTMSCPNSAKCYDTKDKPYFVEK